MESRLRDRLNHLVSSGKLLTLSKKIQEKFEFLFEHTLIFHVAIIESIKKLTFSKMLWPNLKYEV